MLVWSSNICMIVLMAYNTSVGSLTEFFYFVSQIPLPVSSWVTNFLSLLIPGCHPQSMDPNAVTRFNEQQLQDREPSQNCWGWPVVFASQWKDVNLGQEHPCPVMWYGQINLNGSVELYQNIACKTAKRYHIFLCISHKILGSFFTLKYGSRLTCETENLQSPVTIVVSICWW